MLRHLLFAFSLIGSLLPAFPTLAQKPHTPHPATISISQTQEPAWHMEGNKRISDKTGRPVAIYQENYKSLATEPEIIAREYLNAQRALLGLSSDEIRDNLRLHRIRTSETGNTVRLRQVWKGLPVNHNAEITIHINRTGIVDFVQNGYEYGVDLPVITPSITVDEARQNVLNHLQLGNTVQDETTELMVLQYEGKSYLVHHLNFIIDGAIGEWDSYVDAQTNEILKVEDNSYYHHGDPEEPNLPYIWLTYSPAATGTGNIFNPDPLTTATVAYNTTGYTDGTDSDTPQLTAQAQSVSLDDIELAAGVYKLKGPYAEIQDFEAPSKGLFTQTSSVFAFTRSNDAFEAVNTYYHIDNMMRHLNLTLGLTILPYQYSGGVRFDPSGLNAADNSHYVSASGRLAFGEGGVDDAEDADVIIHELGHGLHDWITSGGLSQVNGLSEGTGDYIAGSYSRALGYWTPANQAYYWTFNWDGHNSFWNGRVLNYAAVYPGGLVNAIHTDGQIWATANMKIWDDIGRNRCDKVFWSGLDLTNSSSSQNDAANAVYTASSNLGYTYTERLSIYNRYTAAGYILPAAPLPVELVRFEAARSGAVSLLKWATATEDNNDYFNVERSADGVHFEVIGKVKGAGNSTVEQHYAFTDRRPLGGINYYRLQQTDFGGKTSNSSIQSVMFDDKAAALNLYPNPVSSELSVVSPISEGVVMVLDTDGKVLRSQNITNDSGKTTTSVSLADLNSGFYWVQVVGEGQVFVGKVFKSE